MQPDSPPTRDLNKSTDTSVCETLISVETNQKTTPEYKPGETVLEVPCEFGDYELQHEVARGGMGVVYRARQKSLDRIVALKMIRRDIFDSPADVERFHREARMSAALDHPHIVPIHEVRELNGRHYFTMAFVEGRTLKQSAALLQHDRRQVLEWMTAITEAVQFAHERGIIHRDLKPDNVLIDASGRPRVTDFGLAKRLEGNSELTHSGSLVGTPSYMAPEQAMTGTHPIGPATDVYGLGGILYYLLAGRAPAVGTSLTEVLCNVVQTPPTPPRKLNPAVDADLQDLCLKCLEKDPANRYPTARDLLDRLKALPAAPQPARVTNAGEATVELPPRPVPVNRSRVAQRVMLALGIVLCLVGLGSFAVVFFGSAQPANDFNLQVSIVGAKPDADGVYRYPAGSPAYEIMTERGAFVTIWNVDANDVAIQLFPNEFEKDHWVPANTPRRLSGEGRGYHFDATVSEGRELLIAVASMHPEPEPEGWERAGPFQIKKRDGMESVNRRVRSVRIRPGEGPGGVTRQPRDKEGSPSAEVRIPCLVVPE